MNMDGCTKQSKIKAYINPELVNRNILSTQWKFTENCLASQSVKILINPNFKRSAPTSRRSQPRQQSNFVHINPNFLNAQKSGLTYLHNSTTAGQKNENKSNSNSNGIGFNIKEKNINNPSEVSCGARQLSTAKSEANLNSATFKASLYSWRKTENNESSNACPKEHSFKNALKFVPQKSLCKVSSEDYYKHGCKIFPNPSSGLQSHNHFKYIKDKRLGKCNQSLTKFTRIANPSCSSKAKIINSQSKIKNNSEAQKFLQVKKNSSPTVKSAASMRMKYKCTYKLFKTSLNLKRDEKFLKWNKPHNLWTKENFNSSFYLWKSKSRSNSSQKIGQCYPNRTVVKIGGILYKSSQSKLTRTKGRKKSSSSPKLTKTKLKGKRNHVVYVRGEKFILDKSGKSLRRHPNQKKVSEGKHAVNRVDLGGVTYLRKSNNVLIRTNTHQARYVVNHAKQKSIALLSSLRKRNNMPCMIYRRLGKCARHSKGLCSYNHDKKNVALCKKYLKKECNDSNCLLSHQVVQEKMATCHFFLKGCCNNENCTYLHVKVNSKAPICKDFLQGFCNLGKDCLKRHVYVCPEFDKNGKCSRGDKCLYPHKSKSKIKQKLQKNKIWTKNKMKNSAAVLDKSRVLEGRESDGNQDLKIKKLKRSLLKSETTILLGRRKMGKIFSQDDSSNSDATGTRENIEFIPKRIKLDNLPCFIPLDS